MNKERLIKKLAQKNNTHNNEMKNIVESLFTLIKEELIEGKEVSIVGFGSFSIKKRKARVGRNPNTGKTIQLPEMKTPFFNASTKLKNDIKNKKTKTNSKNDI